MTPPPLQQLDLGATAILTVAICTLAALVAVYYTTVQPNARKIGGGRLGLLVPSLIRLGGLAIWAVFLLAFPLQQRDMSYMEWGFAALVLAIATACVAAPGAQIRVRNAVEALPEASRDAAH
jgi:hypothetical protein